MEDKKPPEETAAFDPDLSPRHESNRAAAAQRGLIFDPNRRVYRDEDGCETHDQFGQPL